MTPQPVPDSTELALRARRGDRDAFSALYDRHAPGIARSLASFVGPQRDLLDDLVQDVFLRVVQGLDGYEPTRPFEAWLFTVAMNVGRNHVRLCQRWSMSTLDDESESFVVEADHDLDVMDLMRLAARLSPELREVVALRVGSDFTFDQIADLLDIPAGTARRRMHTATARLRRAMQANTAEEGKPHERAR